MNRQKNYISRLSKSLLMIMLAVNFIYAGVRSNQQLDMENCCHNIVVEEKSCCMVEPEIVANPSCHQEANQIAESLSSCGCIHNSPISDSSLLLKDNVELPKTFANIIDYQNDDSENTYSSNSKFASFDLSYNSSPIYIVNSSFLI